MGVPRHWKPHLPASSVLGVRFSIHSLSLPPTPPTLLSTTPPSSVGVRALSLMGGRVADGWMTVG